MKKRKNFKEFNNNNNSNNNFIYHIDGNKLKTFSKYQFHKKTFDTKKNNESKNKNGNKNENLIPMENKINRKCHKREGCIKNQFQSQIILN